jgi:hypothetical protein
MFRIFFYFYFLLLEYMLLCRFINLTFRPFTKIFFREGKEISWASKLTLGKLMGGGGLQRIRCVRSELKLNNVSVFLFGEMPS